MQKYQLNFVFCYSPHQPESLVMLRKSEDIFCQMIKLQETLFTWVLDTRNQTFSSEEIDQLRYNIDIPIETYDSLDSVMQKNKKRQKSQRVIMIISQEWQMKSTQLLRNTNIKGIIYFPSKSEGVQRIEQKFILNIKTKSAFLETLKKNRRKVFQYQQLPTFLSLKKQIRTCNIHVRTMFAMLNLKSNQNTRRMIVFHLQELFSKLAQACQQFKHLQPLTHKFIHQIRQCSLTSEEALKWYTCQSAVYKLTNNLLRSVKHPAEAFYIQPFFKDLFTAVQNIHKSQIVNQNEDIICYRGGVINEKQIKLFRENLGDIVHNLGFLSTSLLQEAISVFVTNVWFQILIKRQDCNQSCGFGYAHINKHSEYLSESEILFNPLNLFKVIEISERENKNMLKYSIKLQYCNDQELHDNYSLINKSYNFFGKKNLNQGDVLLRQDEVMDGCLQFWQKYLEIAIKNSPQLYKGLYSLGHYYSIKGYYQKSAYYFKLNNHLISQSMSSSLNQYLILNTINLAIIYCYQQKHGEGRKLLEQSLKNLEINYQHSKKYQLFNVLGIIHYQLCNLNQSQFFFATGLLQMNKYQDVCTRDLIFIYLNLMLVRTRLGKYQWVLLFCEDLECKVKTIWGIQSIQYIKILEIKGLANQRIGNYDQSLRLYKKCAQIKYKKLGSNNPNYLSALNLIAKVNLMQMNLKWSLKQYNRILTKIEEIMQGQKSKQLQQIKKQVSFNRQICLLWRELNSRQTRKSAIFVNFK